MAATFVDLASNRAIRIVAVDSSRDVARRLYPQIESESRKQMQAYRELPATELSREQWVKVPIETTDLPGNKG